MRLLVLLLLFSFPAHAAEETEAAFQSSMATALANNTNGDITPAVMRGEFDDLADSVVFKGGMSWPTADGTSGQHLQTDGAGALTWETPATGIAYASGGTNSFAIDNAASAAVTAGALNSFAIGYNLNVGALHATRGDDIVSIGLDADGTNFCEGNAAVCIGRNVELDCVNGVAIGDNNILDCDGETQEKSTIIGNDNNITGADHCFVMGANNITTDCLQGGIIGESITNNQSGSFAIGNPSTVSTETVAMSNALWTPLYIKPIEDSEGNFVTCDTNSRGAFGFNTTEGALNLCNGTAWQSIPIVPSAGANSTAISQYTMTYLDESSEANFKAAVNLEIGTDVQAYDAGLADIAGLSPTNNAFIVGNGSNFTLETTTNARTSLGLDHLRECVRVSDVGADAATGTGLASWSYDQTVTITGVYAYATVAPTGSVATIDINEGGVSVLSTKLTMDIGEKTSGTAATAAVVSDSSLAANSEITFDIDTVGSTATGQGYVACIKFRL